MHPIEHLRYLAGAQGIDADLLIEEAAHGLGGLDSNRPELVAACRRLLAQQPATGALWGLAARMVTSSEPRTEGFKVLDEIRSDKVGSVLVASLPDDATVVTTPGSSSFIDGFGRRGDVSVRLFDVDGQAASAERRLTRVEVDAEAFEAADLFGSVEACELVVVEALAVGPDEALVGPGAGACAALAMARNRPLWLFVPAGSVMRREYWDAQQALLKPRPQFEYRSQFEYVSLEGVTRLVIGDALISPDELMPAEQPLAPELLTGFG